MQHHPTAHDTRTQQRGWYTPETQARQTALTSAATVNKQHALCVCGWVGVWVSPQSRDSCCTALNTPPLCYGIVSPRKPVAPVVLVAEGCRAASKHGAVKVTQPAMAADQTVKSVLGADTRSSQQHAACSTKCCVCDSTAHRQLAVPQSIPLDAPQSIPATRLVAHTSTPHPPIHADLTAASARFQATADAGTWELVSAHFSQMTSLCLPQLQQRRLKTVRLTPQQHSHGCLSTHVGRFVALCSRHAATLHKAAPSGVAPASLLLTSSAQTCAVATQPALLSHGPDDACAGTSAWALL